MFALIDCNNFYASCERVFRPDLKHRPLIVLSNDNGCVIARSNEAKALGIKMGVPYFKVRGLCRYHQIHVFSSNFNLYGDLSHRVMSIIQNNWPKVEIYSIDEAFLDLTQMHSSHRISFCETLHQRLLKETGIPTSIGIGATKTLAKLANSISKRQLNIPVVDLTQLPHFINDTPVQDVWGIGQRFSATLLAIGIRTAADLAHADSNLIRKRFGLTLQRTAYELRGLSCLTLEDITPHHSILSSKSFEVLQTELKYIAESISTHTQRAWEKLREQHLMTPSITVFIKSNRHRHDLMQYSNTATHVFMTPTDDLRALTRMAKHCLNTIYKPGIFYKKTGVIFHGLSPKHSLQIPLFDQWDENTHQKTERLMKTIEKIHQRYGKKAMKLAAQGTSTPWAVKSNLKSPHYTTRWEEIPVVKA